MPFKVVITDHVWPSTEPETRVLLEEAGAEAVVAPDVSEETLVSMVSDVDAIMTCFAQITPAVLHAARKCVAVGRFGVGVDNIDCDSRWPPAATASPGSSSANTPSSS